jgi:hypothetical protein
MAVTIRKLSFTHLTWCCILKDNYMKLVKAVSETSSWLPFWMIYIIVVAKQRKNTIYRYSDLGTGSWRYSVTVEQYTYIFLYYDFTEKIATTWIPQILHSSANTKIKCFKNVNISKCFKLWLITIKHDLLWIMSLVWSFLNLDFSINTWKEEKVPSHVSHERSGCQEVF